MFFKFNKEQKELSSRSHFFELRGMNGDRDPGPYEDCPPKITYTLEKAWRIESKTKQIPFVVAQELNNSGEPEAPCRQFLVFNDLSHFLYQRSNYPNIHEIIRCPTFVENDEIYYKDDLCKGRLIFDFDIETPLSIIKIFNKNDPNTFVPFNFTWLIEDIVLETFKRYYKINLERLEFGWQYSPNPKKFSVHLIVRNAFFCEYWVQQINTFYSLFKFVAADMDLSYLMEAVDWQVSRRNGTFRMIGSAKVGGGKLSLISYRRNGEELLKTRTPDSIAIENLLCCIYNYKDLKQEQHISMSDLNYVEIKKILESGNNPELEKKVKKYLDISHLKEAPCKVYSSEENSNYDSIVNLFDKFNDGSYKIKGNKGSLIALQRLKSSACPISGQMHEHENPYLIATNNGLLIFRCRRGCKTEKGFEGFVIGTYNKSLLDTPKSQKFDSDSKKGISYSKDQITSKKIVELSVSKILDEIHGNRTVFIDQDLVEKVRSCKVITAEDAVILPDPKTGKNSSRLYTVAPRYEIKIPNNLVRNSNNRVRAK